ncbi:MAG TPA: undecaprenyl-diphosphatase UppP [Candidatus Dormibacteraeota bacterium]|nr:undecaprenyl-diphosphatase UppP [Candidatus Dormibacteraeota bacterium]
MDLVLQAVVLGIVQGLTEFLPISSSWHLIVVPKLAGWDDPFLNSAAFDVMLHAGTLVALVLYFWRDLWRYLLAFVRSIAERRIGADLDRRMAWLLLISVVPAAILGALFENFFDTFFREHDAYLVPLMFLGAAILWLADRLGRRDRQMDGLHVRDAAIIGGAQALALFPGTSRSGITIAAGFFLGLTGEAAARFAFLMAVPVVFGAVVWKMRELVGGGLSAGDAAPLVAGFLAAAIAGVLAIRFLLGYLRGHGLGIFVAYRIVAACVVVVWLLAR